MGMNVRNLDVCKRNTPNGVGHFLFLAFWFSGLSLLSCDTGLSSATITAEEFRFTPNLVKLPAGQNVRLIVRNQGRERHVFQSPILALKDVRWPEEDGGRQGTGESGIPIPPGRRIELSFVLPEGLYPFRCRIKGHMGMEGTLVLEKGGGNEIDFFRQLGG